MAYKPIAYFSGDPTFKLAIPQSAWYSEFMTPCVGGDGLIELREISLDDWGRYLEKQGTNISEAVDSATVNQITQLFKITNTHAISIKVTAEVKNDNSVTGQYFYSRDFEFYWTNVATGTSEIIGRSSFTTRVYYPTGLMVKVPAYIACLICDEEKKCYLQCFGYSATYSGDDFKYYASSSNVTNGPFYSWRFKEDTLYTELYGYANEVDNDPWSNAGYGDVGGGDGTFDFTSDNIQLPQIPDCNAVNTGFIQLFKGTLGEIQALASYMWTDSFWGAIAKLTANPMDVIMSLCMYPFDIPASNRRIVQAGNVVTPITMAVPDNQIIEIDCGIYEVPKFYGSYLDYEPFAKCEIFLPYCGMKTLSLDDIVGRTVNVKYRIDLLTGTCAVFVIVNGTVLYTFSGVCAANIPITSRGFENTISSVLNLASAGVTAFTGAGSAAMVAGFGASAASNVMQSKPTISRSGSISGNSGFMGVQKPFFVFTTPRVAIPKGQATYTGYPIFNTYKLSEISGYTEIEEIHLENMGRATADEITEIEKLLKEGVII